MDLLFKLMALGVMASAAQPSMDCHGLRPRRNDTRHRNISIGLCAGGDDIASM